MANENGNKLNAGIVELLKKGVWVSILGLFVFAWNTNERQGRFEEDIKFYKIIFDKHEVMEQAKDTHVEKRLDSIEEKEDRIKDMIQSNMEDIKKDTNELKKDMGIIKHELKIGNK